MQVRLHMFSLAEDTCSRRTNKRDVHELRVRCFPAGYARRMARLGERVLCIHENIRISSHHHCTGMASDSSLVMLACVSTSIGWRPCHPKIQTPEHPSWFENVLGFVPTTLWRGQAVQRTTKSHTQGSTEDCPANRRAEAWDVSDAVAGKNNNAEWCGGCWNGVYAPGIQADRIETTNVSSEEQEQNHGLDTYWESLSG